MRDHAEALEADLLRIYGLDLALDLGTDRLTWRRLANLIVNLPADSVLARELGSADGQWSLDQHMLATIIDLLASANWQRSGDKKAKRPKPVERPGDRARARTAGNVMGTAMPLAQAKDLLGKWRRGELVATPVKSRKVH